MLKPLVSAGGRHVLRATPGALPVLPPPVEGAPVGWLVQPLLPGIAAGEYACVFVAGELTHTVLKRPATGEFRVQARYGGRVKVTTPPDEVRAAAAGALQALGAGHVYARVDVMVDPSVGAVVMEVEDVPTISVTRYVRLLIRHLQGGGDHIAIEIQGSRDSWAVRLSCGPILAG